MKITRDYDNKKYIEVVILTESLLGRPITDNDFESCRGLIMYNGDPKLNDVIGKVTHIFWGENKKSIIGQVELVEK